MKISKESAIEHNLGSDKFPTPDTYGHMFRKRRTGNNQICIKCGIIKGGNTVIDKFCEYGIED